MTHPAPTGLGTGARHTTLPPGSALKSFNPPDPSNLPEPVSRQNTQAGPIRIVPRRANSDASARPPEQMSPAGAPAVALQLSRVEKILAGKWLASTVGFKLAQKFEPVKLALVRCQAGGLSEQTDQQQVVLAELDRFGQLLDLNLALLAAEPRSGQSLTLHAKRLEHELLAAAMEDFRAVLQQHWQYQGQDQNQPPRLTAATSSPMLAARRLAPAPLSVRLAEQGAANPARRRINVSAKRKSTSALLGTDKTNETGTARKARHRASQRSGQLPHYVRHQDPVTGAIHNSPVLPPPLPLNLALPREVRDALGATHRAMRDVEAMRCHLHREDLAANQSLRVGVRAAAQQLGEAGASATNERFTARLLAALNAWQAVQGQGVALREALPEAGVLNKQIMRVNKRLAGLLGKLETGLFDRLPELALRGEEEVPGVAEKTGEPDDILASGDSQPVDLLQETRKSLLELGADGIRLLDQKYGNHETDTPPDCATQ